MIVLPFYTRSYQDLYTVPSIKMRPHSRMTVRYNLKQSVHSVWFVLYTRKQSLLLGEFENMVIYLIYNALWFLHWREVLLCMWCECFYCYQFCRKIDSAYWKLILSAWHPIRWQLTSVSFKLLHVVFLQFEQLIYQFCHISADYILYFFINYK